MISRSSTRIGELDQRITIQREVLADDGLGGQTVTIETLYECWARVRPRSGSEQDYADRVNAEALQLFVIRYRDGIVEDDRILWGGVQYNIRDINRRGSRVLYLEIDAERGVAQ